MTRNRMFAVVLVSAAVGTSAASAQTSLETGDDGIKYQVTRTVVPRTINETRYEERRYVTYRDQVTTEMQEVQRTYNVPITEQQWVPGWQKTWNVFAPPVLSYRLLPVTRWETRQETVRIPVTKREVIPLEQVQQVPIVSQRVVQGEIVSRMPIGPSSTSTIASNPGGTKMNSDPPRTGWRPAEGSSGSMR